MSGHGLVCKRAFLSGMGLICGPLFVLVEWWDYLPGRRLSQSIPYFLTKTINEMKLMNKQTKKKNK